MRAFCISKLVGSHSIIEAVTAYLWSFARRTWAVQFPAPELKIVEDVLEEAVMETSLGSRVVI